MKGTVAKLSDNSLPSTYYMFSIKKCNIIECTICYISRLPPNIFANLHHLPDPVPRGDHYELFEEVYGKMTREERRPSLKENKVTSHGMLYSPTTQTAKHSVIIIQCHECEK